MCEFGWLVVFHRLSGWSDGGGDGYVLSDKEEEIIDFWLWDSTGTVAGDGRFNGLELTAILETLWLLRRCKFVGYGIWAGVDFCDIWNRGSVLLVCVNGDKNGVFGWNCSCGQ